MILFFYLLTTVGYPLWTRYQTSSWSPTPARVTKSACGDLNDFFFYPWVDFEAEYIVEGTTYTAHLIPKHGLEVYPDLSPAEDQQGLVDALPVGSSVTVFVDPTRPERAVFNRTPPIAWLQTLGTTLILAGGFLLLTRPRAQQA